MKRVTESFVAIFLLLGVGVWWEELREFCRSAVARTNNGVSSDGDEELIYDERPLFILHIGPGKTGTSTIQWYLSENEPLLKQDDIYFLGHHSYDDTRDMHKMLRFCDEINNKECDRDWGEFIEVVEHHHQQNHSVFASEEMIAGFRYDFVEQEHLWRYVKPLLSSSKWRVRIIWTYRRFFEWLPSKYHQAFSPKGAKNSRVKRTSWPDQGGRTIKTFAQYADKRLDEDRFTFLPAIIKRWQEHYPKDISVFNMHQEGLFLENFMCQHVPEANVACKDFSSRASSQIVKNPSATKKLHFDMIATQAYKMGWVDKRLTRKEVVRAVEQRATNMGLVNMTDFPLDCLAPKETMLLLNHSLAYEAEMVPDFYASPQGERDLREKFAQYLESGKFCSVDVDKTLEDEGWRQFFVKLSSGAKGK